MPTGLASLLVLVLAVVPGLPGERIYCLLTGRDWREQSWDRVMRLLFFSLVGLALYTVSAPALGGPLPAYLAPSSLESAAKNPTALPGVFGSLLGHFLGSAIGGVLAAYGTRFLARITSFTPHASAWDHFVVSCVPHHWVLVGLKNGDVFTGRLETADTSVKAVDRDLILNEPAKLDTKAGGYVSLPYQYLFVPGESLASIATVTDPERDYRLTKSGNRLFEEERTDDQENTREKTATTTDEKG